MIIVIIFKLRQLLDGRGMTMYQLSKLSGVRPNTINQWYHNEDLRYQIDEHGKSKDVKSITVDNLIAVCKALDCKLDELIEYVPNDK